MPRHAHLSDLQLVLLSTASARQDGHLYPLRKSIAGKPDEVALAIASLLRHGLVRKVEAGNAVQIWEMQHEVPLGLIATDRARALMDGHDAKSKGFAAEKIMPSVPRDGSKTELVLALLRREEGASAVALTNATGWLPHSMRAALTGLRKKGHVIGREAKGGQSVYRLMTEA